MEDTSIYPEFLRSYDALVQHIRGQLAGLNNTEKGDKFAHLVQRLVPLTDIGNDFLSPVLNPKKSSDGGVDLTAKSTDNNSILIIQSKLYVDRADTIDSVISKFISYITVDQHSNQPYLITPEGQSFCFLLVTLSDLKGILSSYEKENYATKQYYDTWVEEKRISFIYGPQILSYLQAAYKKANVIPTNLTLNFEADVLEKDGVYIGIMSSVEIKRLYSLFGDALFFENVRDFLGIQEKKIKGRTTPNEEIVKTLTTCPTKMLSRNNGIVFGADGVTLGKTKSQLVLTKGSIVNGCQTTMCVWEHAAEPCSLLVKVVQTDNSWDITTAANYQTSVPDIDLKLAEYFRPQLVKKAASNLGIQISDVARSAFQVVDEVYERKIAFNETRLLYIGLLSHAPNNVFGANYTELIQELIAGLYKNSDYEKEVFDTLFMLQRLSTEGLAFSKTIYTNPVYATRFARLYSDDSLPYRCWISLLALSGGIETNLALRENDINKEVTRMRNFLVRAKSFLINDKERFIKKYYRLAVKLWMNEMMGEEDEVEMSRDMNSMSKRLAFGSLYKKLLLEIDSEKFAQ